MKQILCISKNKDKIEKILEIIFWLAVITLITTSILLKPLNDLDEMWNYNFSKNILEGRIPYKDFNIIIMPLVPYIGTIFLVIFGNEMFSMRIFAIITNFIILFTIYKVLLNIKVDKEFSKLIILGLLYILNIHLRIDYNFFSLLLLLLIIYIEIINAKNIHKKNHKIDIVLGILSGLCVCSKQTIGICITIVTMFYQIMFIRNKEDFKIFIKKLFDRFIGFLAVIMLLVIYFCVFDLWNDFIDYAILGIKDFSNKIPYMLLIKSKKWYLKVLSIIVPIYLGMNLIYVLASRAKNKELDTNNVIILAYSWASISVIFPISDEIHFLVGCIPSIIGIIYILSLILLNNKKRWILIETASQVLSIYIVVIAILNSVKMVGALKQTDKGINHFKLIPNTSYSSILEVDDYIKNQNKDVYILDSSAALYTIPINQYNKNYDMFNKGNLGSKGEVGIIEDLKNKTNIQILILQDNYIRNWQTPLKVIDYVKNDLNKIGSVGIFDIYEK